MNQTLEKFFSQNYMYIISIISLGFTLRIIFFPFDIPVLLDGLDYFMYAVDLSRGNVFPEGFLINKFGWGIFLSPFFSIFSNLEPIQLMNLQRVISIILSVSTFIPLYIIAKKFFTDKVSLVVTSLFIFNPKIIENSLLGISEPLFLLQMFLAVSFTLSNKTKFQLLGFLVASFVFITRQEGIFIIFVLIFIIFFKNGINKKNLLLLLMGLIIFSGNLLIIDFVINYNKEISIFDPISNYINLEENQNTIEKNQISDKNNLEILFINSIFNYSKYFILILLPYTLVFFILSVLKIKKICSKPKILFLSIGVILSVTPLMLYGNNFEETRYLFPILLPVIMFSGISITWINNKLKNKKFLSILLICIIFSSWFFLNFLIDDYTYFHELTFAIDYLVENADGVNSFKDSGFIRSYEIIKKWPILPTLNDNLKSNWDLKRFNTNEYSEIESFVKDNQSQGLTHILIKNKNPNILFNELFENENKSYLKKVFDSDDYNFQNKIIIFKIEFKE